MSSKIFNAPGYRQYNQKLLFRSKLNSTIRNFFNSNQFLEVETALVQVSPGLDRYTQPVSVDINQVFNRSTLSRYLHTSPEFAMKKILARGKTNIFQICKAFRDSEDSVIHHPEFSILEWYSLQSDYKKLISQVKDLVSNCADALEIKKFKYRHFSFPINKTWLEITLSDLFIKFVGFNIFDTIDNPLNPSSNKIIKFAEKVGIFCHQEDKWEDVFHKIMIQIIEPKIAEMGLVIVYDYPVCLGSSAKVVDKDVCERAEVYIAGIELANGCSELLGSEDNLNIYRHNQQFNNRLNKKLIPIDMDLVKDLDSLPECAGMALGIDRLLMVLTGAKSIKDVIYSPVNLE